MWFATTAASAVVPSILLVWYFHSRDLRPEPRRVVWATFGLGVLSIVPVLLVALPLGRALEGLPAPPIVAGTAEAFLLAAAPEEFFKFTVLYLFAARREAFDEPMDGIVYGVTASLGFATLENILYTIEGGLSAAVLRAFTAVPGHAFCGAIMGYFVGRARFGRPEDRSRLLRAALLWPIVLHGLYDAPLMTLKRWAPADPPDPADAAGLLALASVTLAVLIVECVWAIRLTCRMRREQREEIAAEAARAAKAPAASSGEAAPAPGAPVPREVPEEPLPTEWADPVAASIEMIRPRRSLAWSLVAGGGALATAGGLVVLSIAAAFAGGTVESEKAASVLVGTIIMGVLPLALGILLFVLGLRRLPGRVRRSAAPALASRISPAGPCRPTTDG